MGYKDPQAKKDMLEWEKANAIEYMRKDKIDEQQKTDTCVISTKDRCIVIAIYFVTSGSMLYKYTKQ